MRNQQYIQNLCQNIRTLQERKGLSTEEMASELGISRELFSCIENGELPDGLTVETLVRLEGKFGISLKDLFLPL